MQDMLKAMRKAFKELDKIEVAAYTTAAKAINAAHTHKMEVFTTSLYKTACLFSVHTW